MPYTIYSSDSHTVLAVSPVTDSNSAVPGTPISLTGATTAEVRFSPQGRPAYTGQGTVTMGTSAVNYKPAAADLQPSGRVEVQVSITYSDGSVLPLQPILLQILEAL